GTIKRQTRLAGWGKIGRAADKPRHGTGDCIANQSRSFPGCFTLMIGRKRRQIVIPPFGKLASLHPVELIRQLWVLLAVFFKHGTPSLVQFPSTATDATLKVLVHAFRNQKLLVLRPAIGPLGEAHLVFP